MFEFSYKAAIELKNRLNFYQKFGRFYAPGKRLRHVTAHDVKALNQDKELLTESKSVPHEIESESETESNPH